MMKEALDLAEQGFSVFPCNNQKQPKIEFGCLAATKDPEQIRSWHREWGNNAFVGIATGKDEGIFVVDLDEKKGQHGISAFDQVCAEHGAYGDAPTVETGSGGRHLYFKYPHKQLIKNSASKLGEGIDIRGDGGYVIAPPSEGYEWLEFEGEEIPHAPEGLLRYIASLEKSKSENGVREIPNQIPMGTINDTLTRYGGLFRKSGFEQDEIANLLKVVVEHRVSEIHKQDPTCLTQCDDIAKSMARYAVDDFSCIDSEVDKMDINEILADAQQHEARHPGKFPSAVFDLPPIIREVMDYCYERARKPQPILSLAAAIGMLGTIVGRLVQTPYGARTNFYFLCLCNSGGGKDAPAKAMGKILEAMNLDQLIGPDDFTSDAALCKHLEVQPCCLSLVDEAHGLISSMSDDKGASHQNKINTVLLKLYTSAGDRMRSKAYADPTKNISINKPNFSMYMSTTPLGFKESFNYRSLQDGLLPRIMIMMSENNDPQKKAIGISEPPEKMITKLNMIRESFISDRMDEVEGSDRVIPRTDSATEILEMFEDEMYLLRKPLQNSHIFSLYTRATEHADQLSLVYACCKNPSDPLIDDEAVTWAVTFSRYLTKLKVYLCTRNIARNDIEREYLDLEEFILGQGEEGVKASFLREKFTNISRRSMDDYMRTMVESGTAVPMFLRKGNGRPRQVYMHVENITDEMVRDMEDVKGD